MKKLTKIISSLVGIGAIALITVPTVISCSGSNASTNNQSNISNNKNNSSNSNSNNNSSKDLSSYLNQNKAIPIANANEGNNDGLPSLFSFAWSNTLNNSSNLISVSSSNQTISFKTNAQEQSNIQWYVTNDESCLINASISLGTSFVSGGIGSINLPNDIFDNLNNHTYYVFAIIYNENMVYPIQSISGVLNAVGNVQLEVSSGWLKNTNGDSALCINNPLTLQVNGINETTSTIRANLDTTTSSTSSNNNSYTYTWNILNYNGSSLTNIGTSSTNSFNYTPTTTGYLTFQCVITKDNTTINTITLNVYIQNWASLIVSNENMVNNILTITNTNQSLSSSLSNSFIPSNSTLTYQWYQSNVNASNLTDNLLFTATGTNSDTLSLNTILPTYTTDYKLEITFNIGNDLHTIVSNIVQVYYQDNAGSISINGTNTSNGVITLDNGDSTTLTLDTSSLKVPATYQWQQEINGSWQNISNQTGSSYTYTEKDSTIAPIRVVATPMQNWNDGSIYSNTITIQTPAISSTLANKIKQTALSYFNNATNLSNIFMSYFMNSANSNYWWLWDSVLAGWWKQAGGFYTSSNGSSFNKITTNNILNCFELTSISVINGSFNNGNPTGSPRLSFNFVVIGNDVYIKNDLGSIAMPKGTTFAFSSPIYIGNVSGESSGFYFGVASNGDVSYSISNSLGSQTDMKYYWGSAWGLNFNGSVYEGLVKQGFFKSQTSNTTTVLYNWLDAPATIIINNNTTPALPNFYEEVLNNNVSITITPNLNTSSSLPLGFNLGTKTLSVSASLSNNADSTFTYTWQSMKQGDTTWTNMNNASNSLTLTYPSGVLSAYVMLYKVTVQTTYNNQTYTNTYTFYVNYEPTNANTN